MNPNDTDLGRTTLTGWAVGVGGTFLLMLLMAWLLYHYTRPEPVDAQRVAERYQFLLETQEAEATARETYAWQVPDKEIARIPIDRAMELVLREWQDPAAARAALIARVEVATEPPPPPPEPENIYE